MAYFQGPNVILCITYKKAPLHLRVPFKTSQDLEARTQESLNQFIDSQANGTKGLINRDFLWNFDGMLMELFWNCDGRFSGVVHGLLMDFHGFVHGTLTESYGI